MPGPAGPLRGDSAAAVCLLTRLFGTMLTKAGLNDYETPPHYGVCNTDGLRVLVIELLDMEHYTWLVKESSPVEQVNTPAALATHVQWLLNVVPPALNAALAKFKLEHPVLAQMPLVEYVLAFFVQLLETTVHGFPQDAQRTMEYQLAVAATDSEASDGSDGGSDFDGIHGGFGI
eukprot:13658218-Alexandrium_andersonii.AAC.1